MFKRLIVLAVCALFLVSLIQTGLCQTPSVDEWLIEDNGGYYSQNDNVLHLWSNGGIDCPSITFWKEIKPLDNFSVSVEVNAETNESCAIFVRNRPESDTLEGFNFEFGHYGANVFLLARNFSNWMTSQVATGEIHVWYTMKLDVSRSPFRITISVFDLNGTCLGSVSTSEITYFNFEDIKYIGLGVWGYSPSDYSFRNITISLDSEASNISMSTQASSTTAGAIVDIYGVLTDLEGLPVQNRTIVLSYRFSGLDSWIPISSTVTNQNGEYFMQWINNAAGTFTLKAECRDNSIYSGISNTTTLSFLPVENQQTFVFESNSTVTSLNFNNETSTLNFNVTGPTGTTGYVKAVIPKTLLKEGETLQAYIDGKQLEYEIISTVKSWIYFFNYTHSTHQISIKVPSENTIQQPPINQLVLLGIIVVFGTILVLEIFLLRNKNEINR